MVNDLTLALRMDPEIVCSARHAKYCFRRSSYQRSLPVQGSHACIDNGSRICFLCATCQLQRSAEQLGKSFAGAGMSCLHDQRTEEFFALCDM